MKRSEYKIRYLFTFLLFIVLFANLFPVITHAQCPSSIVPCGRSCDDPKTTLTDESKPCTLCHLVIGIQGIIQYGFKIVVFVALVAIVAAGIMYVVSAGNEQTMQTAKNFIKTTLIGFAIVLGAWVIVNTTLWLIGTKADLGVSGNGIVVESWSKFSCSSATDNNTKWTCDIVDGVGNCRQDNNGSLTLKQCEDTCPVQKPDKCGANNEGVCYAGVTCESIGLKRIGNCNDGRLCCTAP